MKIIFGFIAAILLATSAFAQSAADLNPLVLEQINAMPSGGRYAATRVATIALQSAAHFEQGKFFILPGAASPSYCSGATYLVFLKTIERLRRDGLLTLDSPTLSSLVIRDGQGDGSGVWGRWNANGPGTARLFHELAIGENSAEFATAKPGDFMKIFWTGEVGKSEHGHSVIFLGTEARTDGEYVRFWSSNIPAGYGEKAVPRTKIAQAIFSRFENPRNLARIATLPPTDAYLASLTSKASSFAEAKAKCGF
ncbi:MAG: hypothetical protein QOD99_1750 [Chthoniobacter sp.]|jgi:hypothetical protein|nr:hypothetical protein [Chthoniobacter sp.]